MPSNTLNIILLTGALCLSACEKTEAALTDETQQPPTVAKKQTDDKPTTKNQVEKPPAASPAQKTKTKRKTLMQHKTSSQKAPTHKPPTLTKPFKKPHSFTVRRCMNMGNALESPVEGEWGYRIRRKDFRIIADAGFDTVRVPIRWDTHTGLTAPYHINPNFMARIKQVVSDAKAAGLNIIIDVHHFEGLMQNPAQEEARFLSIWRQIAKTFSNEPSSVYFEVLNEPKENLGTNKMNALYAKVVKIIRHSNPSRIIILGGYPWNHLEGMSDVKWPNGGNLVATFHYYDPHNFTHQGAEWETPIQPMGVTWGSRRDLTEMQNTYAAAKNFTNQTGLHVFIGELGVINKVPLAQRNQWIKEQRKAIESTGMSWCAWDFSGAFNAYDISNERWLPGILDAYTGR